MIIVMALDRAAPAKRDKKKFAKALDQATKGDSTVDPRYLSVDSPPWEDQE